MNLENINTILKELSIDPVKSFQKSDVGFTNTIYFLDDLYVLKVCNDKSNEFNFKLEAALYKHFSATTLPVPQVVTYDDTCRHIKDHFILYRKINGQNLYDVWPELDVDVRRSVVKQLCDIHRTLNNTNPSELSGVSLLTPDNWKDKILRDITQYRVACSGAGLLNAQEAHQIDEYVNLNSECLNDVRFGLVNWDAHFDNILVRGGTVVGLLDLERTEIASLDLTLDIVKRMVEYPTKYMSERAKELHVNDEDYAELMDWYKEFYPELFAFDDIEHRLALYSLAHDLKDLVGWPKYAEPIRKSIFKTVETN